MSLRIRHTPTARTPSAGTDPNDSTFYLPLNMTQPPFDDVHLRKAMNWIMDKATIIQAVGGPTTGKPATTTTSSARA